MTSHDGDPQRCCEAVRSATLATSWLRVSRYPDTQLYMTGIVLEAKWSAADHSAFQFTLNSSVVVVGLSYHIAVPQNVFLWF